MSEKAQPDKTSPTNGAPVKPLSAAERKRLTELEATIDPGLKTFIEVGQALLEVRDRRLYREEDATFEAYCERRYGLPVREAYRLIDCARAEDILCPIGQKPALPNEAVARELAPLIGEPDRMRDAWNLAQQNAGGKRVTAKIVCEAVEQTVAASTNFETRLAAAAQKQYKNEPERLGAARVLASFAKTLPNPVKKMRRIAETFGLPAFAVRCDNPPRALVPEPRPEPPASPEAKVRPIGVASQNGNPKPQPSNPSETTPPESSQSFIKREAPASPKSESPQPVTDANPTRSTPAQSKSRAERLAEDLTEYLLFEPRKVADVAEQLGLRDLKATKEFMATNLKDIQGYTRESVMTLKLLVAALEEELEAQNYFEDTLV